MAAAARRRAARQARALVDIIEAHAEPWKWSGNRGATIIWDGRRSHVGHYVAVDPDGTLYYNRYYGDGRGMTDYNYGFRRLPDEPRDGPSNTYLSAALAALAEKEMV